MRILNIIAILLTVLPGQTQTSYPDSLKSLLKHAETDSARYLINKKLISYYYGIDRKRMYEHSEEMINIARKNNRLLDVASGLDDMGYYLNKEDRYGEAFKCLIEGIRLAEDPANERYTWSRPADADPYQYRMEILASLYHDLGHVYWSTGNNRDAIQQFRKCLHYIDKALPTSYNTAYMNIGAVYLDMNMLDSALYYLRKELPRTEGWKSSVYKYIGDIHFRKGNADSSFLYYHLGLASATDQTRFSQKITCEMRLAEWHLAAKNTDSSMYYSNLFLRDMERLQGNPLKGVNISNAYELVSRAYRLTGQNDSTLRYLQLAYNASDEINGERIRSLAQYQNLTFSEQLRMEELDKEKLQTQNRIRIYGLLSVLIFFFCIALILYRNSREKQKTNTILKQALSNLKSTQSQLIQSEKMASLGELTAGIAHEIQNPLNFVNNFSEVSNELIKEMKEEFKNGDVEEGFAIADDIEQNLEKINHHGKRADAIVKGMLAHSRSSSGEKTLTDINALADEYLRLSYHGLRAKDKSFNADFKTDFDPDLPQAKVIPQDMGRVLLNLINNAFYAVNEKAKIGIEGYQPLVNVSTTKVDGYIEIKVSDNGNGIPEQVREKIFQPFFTTKPTGQGTGLGLSLSYDIVKAHGGEIRVESEEGVGTEFIITLPFKINHIS